MSATIESDNMFCSIIESVWNLDNRDNVDTVPFAGSRDKILAVNHK